MPDVSDLLSGRPRWWREVVVCAFAVLWVGSVAASDCPVSYDFGSDNIDYYDPDPQRQARIRGIESNHMNQSVRSLQKGQSTANASGDLRFVISIVPNHPEALALMMRLAVRSRTDRLPEAGPYTVECWLHRATLFSPKDSSALMIYGIYLGHKGKRTEAITVLEQADALKPGDANISYNLGLMYFEQKDYARARDYAKRAYEAGFPLPGLKDKLKHAGQWSD